MVVVVGVVLGGWDAADLAVWVPVVELVDVIGDGDLEVVDVLSWVFVADQFGFGQGVERLGEGVVVGVPGRPD